MLDQGFEKPEVCAFQLEHAAWMCFVCTPRAMSYVNADADY